MRRFYFTVFTILALAIIAVNPYYSFAYEKELKSISTAMSEKIARAGKKTVAVVDFTDLQGNVTELGRFVAEEFSVSLADADKGFEVVDRTHLQTLLKEYKLSTTGIIDPSTAKKLGEIAGFDALITGTITPFGDNVRISIKILDTSTAKVIGASSGEIAKTKAIEELLGKGIGTEAQRVFVTPTPDLTSASAPPDKTQQKVNVENFVFELQGCKLSGQNVTCHVLITVNGKDKPLTIYTKRYEPSSRIFDNSGNEYGAEIIQFGDKKANSYVSDRLVSGVPTMASVSFENISTQASRITLLELGCSYQDDNDRRKEFRAQLHNIPLTR